MSGPDVELADDLVGVASARMLANGVSRVDRFGALRLLGALESAVDCDRRIRRPLDDVAGEFDLPPALVTGWYRNLVDAGVVEEQGGQLVLAAVEPPSRGALRLHDFLDAAAELEDQRSTPHRLRGLRPAVAVLAAAAAVLTFLAVPGLRDHPQPASSTGTVISPTGPELGTTGTGPSTDVAAPGGRTGHRGTAATSAPTAGPAGAAGAVAGPTTSTTSPPPCATGPLLQVLGSSDTRIPTQAPPLTTCPAP